jgi:hypothetical protein
LSATQLGAPGVLKSGPSGQLIWVTDDGVPVTLHHSGRDGQEDLLEIGRSVGPVSADEERLAAAWTTEPAEQPPAGAIGGVRGR